jgi:hypothetical protein
MSRPTYLIIDYAEGIFSDADYVDYLLEIEYNQYPSTLLDIPEHILDLYYDALANLDQQTQPSQPRSKATKSSGDWIVYVFWLVVIGFLVWCFFSSPKVQTWLSYH